MKSCYSCAGIQYWLLLVIDHYWFVSDLLSVYLVAQELTAVSEKWQYTGEELGVEQSLLRCIRSNYSDPGDCLKEVLSRPFESCATTWGDIIGVLRSPRIGDFQLADNLKAKYYPSESLQLKFIECKPWKYYHNPSMLNMHGRNKVLHNLCNGNGIFQLCNNSTSFVTVSRVKLNAYPTKRMSCWH